MTWLCGTDYNEQDEPRGNGYSPRGGAPDRWDAAAAGRKDNPARQDPARQACRESFRVTSVKRGKS